MQRLKVLLGTSLLTMASVGCGSKDSKKDEDKHTAPTPTVNDEANPPAGASTGVALADLSGTTAARKGSYRVKLEWNQPLRAEQNLSAKLTFVDGEGKALQAVSNVEFIPWMAMGHGSYMKDQKVVRDPAASNVFNVTGIYLTMGGTWDIKVLAKVNGTPADSAIISVDVP